MSLLKRKPNGEFEGWRIYSPTTNASNPPDSRTRKRKVKPEDTSRPDLPPTSSQTSLDSDRPTKRFRKVKLEDNDWLGGAGDTRSSGASTGSRIPSTASGTGLQVNNLSKAKAKAKIPREAKPKPEKRGAIFKKKCPQNILDRLNRVTEQRFFMIDRERDGDEPKETFNVLGSTGNVYTVVIDHTPRCNCPDALKGNHCKHIIFVFIKVLQVHHESSHWYQKALLTAELQDIFAHAPNAVANERLRQAHLQATGKAPASGSNKASNKRMPTEEDDCPICYDKMHTEPENRLTWCEVCGNALHGVCFAQWQATALKSGKNVTCVWCRAEWVLPDAGKGKGKGKAIGEEGYVNLAAVAGVSPQRDTSSYYHGVGRGGRYYGYQKYGAQ
ncbi:hypothetical protein EDD18DRAFT_1129186 [Armillaria luteobubalina]|uniref:SWIM-type domain-containing protein n=1 Tax=Armillaria luteobubalina TaxID=153913 RepID=A0AA39QLY8_9AGAR|nr:hypothetical protein EDD18DRAFT_1129186 [Armillaria luteobubalina]